MRELDMCSQSFTGEMASMLEVQEMRTENGLAGADKTWTVSCYINCKYKSLLTNFYTLLMLVKTVYSTSDITTAHLEMFAKPFD